GRLTRVEIVLGGRVRCADGTRGDLLDVVVDPVARRLTHVVVRCGRRSPTRLVPVDLVVEGSGGAVELACDSSALEQLPTRQALAVDAGRITSLTARRGRVWWRRDVSVPVDAVEAFRTDVLRLRLSRAEIDALPRG